MREPLQVHHGRRPQGREELPLRHQHDLQAEDGAQAIQAEVGNRDLLTGSTTGSLRKPLRRTTPWGCYTTPSRSASTTLGASSTPTRTGTQSCSRRRYLPPPGAAGPVSRPRPDSKDGRPRVMLIRIYCYRATTFLRFNSRLSPLLDRICPAKPVRSRRNQ